MYFVAVCAPRKVVKFNFVDQIPMLTERLCSVTLCDRFSCHMFSGVTRRNERQTIGDRLTQCMKIKVENMEPLIIVFAGVRNLALKLYSNSSWIFLENGVFSVTEQERSVSMGIWTTKSNFITFTGTRERHDRQKTWFKAYQSPLEYGPPLFDRDIPTQYLSPPAKLSISVSNNRLSESVLSICQYLSIDDNRESSVSLWKRVSISVSFTANHHIPIATLAEIYTTWAYTVSWLCHHQHGGRRWGT